MRWLSLSGVLALAFVSCASAAPPNPQRLDAKSAEFFETKIRPVLTQRCYKCHSAEAREVKGGLLLDTRQGLRDGGDTHAAVVPGNPEESLLIAAILYEGLEMPPDERLPDAVVADFVKWIEMGAPDPREGAMAKVRRLIDIDEGRKFWSFQPVTVSQAPAVNDRAWPRNDIDRFILATLETEGLHPNGDTDRRTLVRRATLDLTGLLPTPAEVAAFVHDEGPDAFDGLVDRLLGSPRFGEWWGRHWLDVARYAESSGMDRNYPYHHAWRYRNYVIDSLNSDKPYDRFLCEQIAGDLLVGDHDEPREATNERLIATGFLAIGPKGFNAPPDEFAMDVANEQIDVTCRAILGLTVSCARCHDHKFDPIPTTDYYALAGIFRSTTTLVGVKKDRDSDYIGELYPLGKDAAEKVARNAELDEQIKSLERDLKALRNQLAQLDANGKVAKADAEKSESGVETEPPPEAANGAHDAPHVDARRDELRGKIKDLQARLKEVRETPRELPELAMATVEAKQARNCHVCIRGNVDEPGAEVPRGFLSVISGEPAQIDAAHSGRLELARWLTSRDNPLTARVMVNRVWHHLFGRGLVETVDDFGVQGALPSHPELLDYLAARFVEQGWSIKRLLREIMLSRAYQLASDHNDASYAVDPDNRLQWRMNRRRLHAEAIRDAILQVSGELSCDRPESSALSAIPQYESLDAGAAKLGRPSTRRSVYLPVLRNVPSEMLTVFDTADPSLLVGRREITIVPTQALYMMNSEFVVEQSQKAAERLLGRPLDDRRRVDLAYRLALARHATDDERQRVLDFVRRFSTTGPQQNNAESVRQTSAWAAFVQALFCSAEFRYVY